MSESPRLTRVTPTVLLAREGEGLRQLVRVTVDNPGPACAAEIALLSAPPGAAAAVALPERAEATHEFFIPEVAEATRLVFALRVDGAEVHRSEVAWAPPPHLRVHLVQHSHHDVGYTNLPSAVLREHCGFLDEVLELADATAQYPADSRFRVVIEQAWSLLEYSRRAPAERLERLGALLRRG